MYNYLYSRFPGVKCQHARPLCKSLLFKTRSITSACILFCTARPRMLDWYIYSYLKLPASPPLFEFKTPLTSNMYKLYYLAFCSKHLQLHQHVHSRFGQPRMLDWQFPLAYNAKHSSSLDNSRFELGCQLIGLHSRIRARLGRVATRQTLSSAPPSPHPPPPVCPGAWEERVWGRD